MKLSYAWVFQEICIEVRTGNAMDQAERFCAEITSRGTANLITVPWSNLVSDQLARSKRITAVAQVG
jgi:hypothetical protein